MENEIVIRLLFFSGIFILITGWEIISPRRKLTASKTRRWVVNMFITVFNSLFVRLIMPILAIGLAALAALKGWGLMNIVPVPYWLSVVVGIVILDLIIYLQHVMFHSVSVLWRLHMIHHADLDIDVTTGLRFHPIEIMFSAGIKLAAVLLIGIPVLSVLVFEILLNATSMFNHGNIYIKADIDKILRLILVTPDMHRVHHSVIIKETNSNFGFNLPWWDRLFGTYISQPSAGHKEMTIGLAQFRDEKKQTILWFLITPFIGVPGENTVK